ncbi:testis-expressed protein 30-like [Gigantopelta aegis]|uniref:testis-expressed protein 30-like n=1 Tax=Gigantopelta aegis TaxID=1735272 RepID=UPI001B8890F8|nr:testis-expressed protein 30-like [Gigantopelta aegis]
MNSKQLVLLAEAIADKGVAVLRFTCKGLNLKYRTKVYTKVVEFLLASSYGIKICILAGRSMGSRAAVNVANENESTDISASIIGVICLSYPLYPPESPDKIRDAPLYNLSCPVIFISGEKDEMCKRERMESVLKRMSRADMHWIQHAGHDLIDKSVGLEATVNMIADKVFLWCSKICPEIALPVAATEKKRKQTPPLTSVRKSKRGERSDLLARDEDEESVRAASLGTSANSSYKRISSRKRKRSIWAKGNRDTESM